MRYAGKLAAAAVCCGIVAVSGCGRSRAARAAAPYPAAFTPVEWGAAASGAPGAQEGCAVSIRDDRDGTMLLLRRSESRRETTREGDATVTHYRATGDYEVLTPGRYGITANQWLRVNCGTWRAVGPVPRTG